MEHDRAVLILDDEPAIIDLILLGLCPGQWSVGETRRSAPCSLVVTDGEFRGLRFLIACTGDDATDIVARAVQAGQDVAGAFVDLRLPGEVQGAQVIRRLREAIPGLLCTVVTGQPGDLDEILSIFSPHALDQWDYVAKPFERLAIAQRCRQMLASAARRKQEAADRLQIARLNRELELWAESLQERVAHRTVQLSEAVTDLEERNAELAEVLRVLQATQSELVAHERLASIGQLAAGVAHELSRPLAFSLTSLVGVERSVEQIVAFADRIETESLPRPEAGGSDGSVRAQFFEMCRDERPVAQESAALSQIARATDGLARASTIVKELGILAAPSLDHVADVDVGDTLVAAIDLVRAGLERGERIDVAFEQLPLVRGNPADLQLAWVHLLRNAIDATAERAGSARIRVSAHVVGDDVIVEITDNGRGLAADVRERAFEPFFTTQEGHSGLGLSIVHGVLRRHGGEATFCATEGDGCTVRVTIPLLGAMTLERPALRQPKIRLVRTAQIDAARDCVGPR